MTGHQRTHHLDTTDLMAGLVAEVLPEWGLENADMQLISVSENLGFRVRNNADDAGYILRVHRPGYHDLQELESEQLWTEALSQAGISVPTSVSTRSGHRYVPFQIPVSESFPAPQPTRYVGLANWQPGEILSQSEFVGDPQQYRNLGRVMAQMHRQAIEWSVPSEFKRHSFDADGLMGDTPFWGRFWEHPLLTPEQRSLVSAVRPLLHERLLALKGDENFSMIHGDMHGSNILIDDNRLRVIDFDDAGFGLHAYDLAVALFHHRDQDNYQRLRDALLDGYCEVRPGYECFAEQLPMFFFIRSLASIGWIGDRPEINQARVPDLIRRSCEMANRFLSSDS